VAEPFQTQITVRGYELDSQGHLNNAVYHQYGDHARWECLRAAGISVDDLLASGLGPVTLESTIRFHRELRGGQDVTVSCAFVWGERKTFRVDQQFHSSDGTLVAEIVSIGGLMNIAERRHLADPGEHGRALAPTPELLGL
jgi:acyl-CoA thioester hydrolase